MKKLTKMYRFHLGYTLVEAILVAAVIVLLIGSVYSYYRYAHASEKGLEESTNVAMLTKSVADAYESMANFGNVSTATAISENLIPKNFTTTSNTLYSPNGYQVALASETLSGVAGRGFSVTYKSVDQQMCSALVANTNTMQKFVSIKVGSTQVGTRGTIDEAATATACKNAPVDVAFVYQRFGTGEVTDLEQCVVPAPQTQELPCAPGYLGKIVQERTAVCNGPYEIPVWNAWVTTSDTCAIACVVDPTSPETKTESCATGYLGLKTYKRVSTCAGPTGYPTWGAWTLESDTCLIACVVPAPIVVMENCSTKSGFGSDWTGTYVTTTEAACPSQTGSPSWKTPTVQNNCSKKCVAPAPTPALRTSTPCPSGQSGVITESQTTSWTCPSATGSPVSSTSAWTVVSNTCAATCTAPAPTAEAITRAAAPESQNVGCPYPQVGEHWQQRSRVENGTRTTSWTCPGPTPSTNDTWLGTYNYGAWTTTSNTCAPSAPTCDGNYGVWGGDVLSTSNFVCPAADAAVGGSRNGQPVFEHSSGRFFVRTSTTSNTWVEITSQVQACGGGGTGLYGPYNPAIYNIWLGGPVGALPASVCNPPPPAAPACVSAANPFVVTSMKLDVKAGYNTGSTTTLGQIVHISNSSRYTMTANATITGTFNGTTYTATISTGQMGSTGSTGSCARYAGSTTGASAGCSAGGSLPPGQDAEVFMANATQAVVYLKSRACP